MRESNYCTKATHQKVFSVDSNDVLIYNQIQLKRKDEKIEIRKNHY